MVQYGWSNQEDCLDVLIAKDKAMTFLLASLYIHINLYEHLINMLLIYNIV